MDVEVVGWLVLYSWLVLVWVVLSDEQMSKRWPFSLLNDEQMSNWVGVEHLPVVDGMLWLDVDWIYYSLRTVSQTKTI